GHGLIYLTSGHTSQLIAVRQGGSGDLTKTGIAWKATRGVPTRPSPLLVEDRLYMISDKGIATCLDAITGKQLWTERLGGDFWASPLCADGQIFLCDEEGKTHVVKPGPRFESIAINSLEGGCMGSPVAVGDALLIRTKAHLCCVGK